MNDEIVAEIKRRILVFITDNPRCAGLQLQLETAALIGAAVALEKDDPFMLPTPSRDEILKHLFKLDE